MENKHFIFKLTVLVAIAFSIFLIGRPDALAHCDAVDGPVILAAKTALGSGDVKPVLAWVKEDDEAYIKSAFERTLAIGKLSPEARELAETYFFETLVRIHRAGEGAPYTGLKPAGQIEHAVFLVDRAIESESVEALVQELNEAVSKEIRELFRQLAEKKRHVNHGVEAGREFVASYVEFMHYVERLHKDITSGAHEHGAHTAKKAREHHEHN